MSTYTPPDNRCAERSDDLETDALLELVRDPYRRRIIRELDRAERIDRSQLADRIASEFGDDKERVAIQLAHNHVPRLEDYSVLETDGSYIRAGPQYPAARRFLAHVR